MRRMGITVAAGLWLVGAAQAGTVAGARDGTYRAADGGLVLVASGDARVSLDGLDCLHPSVRGGRLVSRECWGNGHRRANVDVSWRAEGDAVVVRGKRYVRAGTPTAPPAASAPSRAEPTGRPWRHNGSVVMLDEGTGVIAYLEPKAALRPSVAVGTVLFRGQVHPDRPVHGTAYAYKTGCPPAPYAVRGTYVGGNLLVLRGAGPVRSGCAVTGYSDRSPHSVLKFTYLLDD